MNNCTYEDLEDGKVAEEALHQFHLHQNNQNLFELLNILRDSTVMVPLVSPELSSEEMERIMNLEEGADFHFMQDLRFKVDCFKNAQGNPYYPIFTSENVIPEDYHNHMSFVTESLIAIIMDIFHNEFYHGLVINPFTENLTIERDHYAVLTSQRGIVTNKNNQDAFIQYFNKGIEDYNQDTPEGYQEAEKIFLDLSAMGFADADLNLGYIYMYGKVGEANRKKGFDYFIRAAHSGNLSALIKLADDYMSGEFNEKNEKLGFDLYMKVMLETHRKKSYRSEGGVFLRLAKCYEKGTGCPRNPYDAYTMADAAYHIFKDHSDLWYYAAQVEEAKELAEKCYKESLLDHTNRPLKELKQYRRILVYMNYQCDQEYTGSLVQVETNQQGNTSYELLVPMSLDETGIKISKNLTCYHRALKQEEISNCEYVDIRIRLEKINKQE